MSSLHQILKADPKLQTILSAPTLSDNDKSQIVAELEKHTGGQDKSNTVKNFLGALAENNRLSILEGVCEKFGTLMSAARGEMELTITTASVSAVSLYRYPRFFDDFDLLVALCSTYYSKRKLENFTCVVPCHDCTFSGNMLITRILYH